MKRYFVILSCLFLCSWSVQCVEGSGIQQEDEDTESQSNESLGDHRDSSGGGGSPGSSLSTPRENFPHTLERGKSRITSTISDEAVEQVPQYPSRSQRMAMRMRGIPVPARLFDCRRDCTRSNCKKVDIQHQCRQQCSQIPNIDRCFQANYKADFKRATGARLSAQVIKAEKLKHLDFLKSFSRKGGHQEGFDLRYLQGALSIANHSLRLTHTPAEHTYLKLPAGQRGAEPATDDEVPMHDLDVVKRMIVPHYQQTCANLGRQFKERSIFPGRRANRLHDAQNKIEDFQRSGDDIKLYSLPERPTVHDVNEYITSLENHLQNVCFATGERLHTTARPSILGRR